VGFALIYVLMQYYPPLAALPILALLPCILLRVDESRRKIGQAPLTFATLMLAQKVFSAQVNGLPRGYSFSSWWMPLFLAVCLFYMPSTISWSRNMLVVLGTVLLLTGLLPGNLFAVAFAMVEYFLFAAVAIALSMDFFGSRAPRSQPAPH
jgi:hypothetical protein